MKCAFCGNTMFQSKNNARHLEGSAQYHYIEYTCGPSPGITHRKTREEIIAINYCGAVAAFDLVYTALKREPEGGGYFDSAGVAHRRLSADDIPTGKQPSDYTNQQG